VQPDPHNKRAGDRRYPKFEQQRRHHHIIIPIDVQVLIAALAPLCIIVLILAIASARQ
jgi:hypothetical protein